MMKHVLTGSVAALAMTTGAFAADAVVFAEPEPMDYVRVCDVYGAGFYYIPGTETCLKIGGYVRYQINWLENDLDDGFAKYSRLTLGVDARSETELGTLRSFMELRGEYSSGGAAFGTDGFTVRQAFIELGGFKIGVATTINDDDLFGEFDSVGYDDRVHMAGYTWDGANGFSATINLEEYDSNYDYTPNVIGRLAVEQGWGGVRLYGAYDATAEEWFAKLIGSFNLAEKITLQYLATYESDESVYSVSWAGVPGGYEYTAGAYLRYAATDKLAIGFGGQYFGDKHSDLLVNGVTFLTAGNDDWAVGGVVDYEVVKDFNIKTAVNYFDGDTVDDGFFGGFVRFQRDF